MAKPLVIVESQAKAETVAGFLGRDDYVVMASVGHIRDLPRRASEVPRSVTKPEVRRLGIDVENHFAPVYVVPSDKKQVVVRLKAAMKQASELYLATDEDREGEAISWHLKEVLNPRVPVKRMVFHEITNEAIVEALANWRDLDMRLVEAQEGRRILDRLVGYEVSNVTFRRIGRRASAGRVQSVATRLVVDRERARMAFRAASYWDLEGDFRADGGEFPATLTSVDGRRLATGRDFEASTGALVPGTGVVLLDEDAARALVQRLEGRPFTVVAVEARAVVERPRAPFITSTLQQEAARKLGFSAARTMHVAQGLYERGLITYMRTDSTALSEQAVLAARAQIRRMYGNEFLPDEPRVYRSRVKNAQEAHEAIRPAGDGMYTADDLSAELKGADERRLYDLVWTRTVASQMADARIRRVTLRLRATTATPGHAAEELVFQASGRTIEFPGYLRAYVEGSDDPDAELEDREVVLPPLREGDGVECRELRPARHTTQPPPRYTEASLVKELEERGIGRPSTYASVLDTIVNKRDYVWKKGTALVPTWTAFAKVQLLERYFAHLIDYEFTATMEEALDAIARGEAEAEKWLHSFYFGNGQVGLRDLVAEEHVATIDKAEVNAVPIGHDAHGRPLIVRVWPNGANVERGDERAPVPADLAPDELTVERAEDLLARGGAGPRVLGTDPVSGVPVLAMSGRYGPFVQLGETIDSAKEKPKRASLFASMDLETLTLDDALALLSLPRVVGRDDDGTEITAQNGRYGPYLRKGSETRSLQSEEQLFTVTLDEARALFAQPKQRRGRTAKPPLAELGAHPDSGAPVRVLDGRYGPYVTDGTTNASLPRGVDAGSVTLEQGLELLRERVARAPAAARARKPGKKAARKAARKPANKATRRAATAAATTKTATTKKTTTP